MSKQDASPDDLSAWKAQQEANRAARVKQLYSPAELWRRQQEALTALEKLRPDTKHWRDQERRKTKTRSS